MSQHAGTRYLLAGGGTAGHVNPLLAVADFIRRNEVEAEIFVLGTKEGLEATLVPAQGYPLLTVPKVPFPRRPDLTLLTFLPKLQQAVKQTIRHIRDNRIDIVVGFGGFASAPAYLAARKLKLPIVIHEANIRPGMANRLGARYTDALAVSFSETVFGNARHVGTPLRRELETFNREVLLSEARQFFELGDRPTLLITGGSQGALHINQTMGQRINEIIEAGFQIIHLHGAKNDPAEVLSPHYRPMAYLNRMDLALALADLAVSRAGATTVSELAAVGLPAVFVPLPHGNGEQKLNAQGMVAAGAAILVENADFTPEWVDSQLLPLLGDAERLAAMREAASTIGIRDGSERMYRLIRETLEAAA